MRQVMTRRVWPWLRPLIAVAIVAVLVWRLGTDAFVAGFRLIDSAAVLAALGIGLLTTVLSAGRWCLVARRLGLRLPLAAAVADYYRALFLNAVLPVGVLGDAERALRHGRQAGDLGRGVRAVVFERVGGQAVLILVAVAVLVVHPFPVSGVALHVEPGRAVTVAALTGLVAAIALTAWVRWGRRTSRAHRALVATLADSRRGLLARDTWPGVVLLSTAVLAGHLALFLVAARTAGSSAPAVQLLPLMVLALLAMALPVNVGGWGPREAVSALAFGAAGLGSTLGLTIAVTYGVLTLVASLPGAALVVLRRAWPLRRPAGTAGPVPRWYACEGDGERIVAPREDMRESSR